MNVFEALLKRKRAKSFLDEEVEERYIGLILHAATHAPSAGNLKPWEFVVVRDEEIRKEIKKHALEEKKIEEAKYLIIVCIDIEKLRLRYGDKAEIFADQDGASAITYIILAAKGLNLDCDWIRVFNEERVSQILELPENLKIKGIVPIGKGKEFEEEFELPFENITHLEKYGGKEFKEGSIIREILKKHLFK